MMGFLKQHGIVSKAFYGYYTRAVRQRKSTDEATGDAANPFRDKIKGRFKKLSVVMLLVAMSLSSSCNVLASDDDKCFEEKLDRGCVAVATNGCNLVEWRKFVDDDAAGISYRLQIMSSDGTRRYVDIPMGSATCYADSTSGVSYDLYVKDSSGNIIDSQTMTDIRPMTDGLLTIRLDRLSEKYTPNDMSVADVDGDGAYELIVKWAPNNSRDNSHNGMTDATLFDCYEISGTDLGKKLWRIDLGCNIRSGAHYNPFLVYDFDGDGKAEFVVKTAPGTKDGNGDYVSKVFATGNAEGTSVSGSAGFDDAADYRNENGHVVDGAEFLTIFSGESGKALQTVWYNPNRGQSCGTVGKYGNWESVAGRPTNYNRGERYNACVAYLDGLGHRPSIVMQRGYYTFSYFWAVDWDGKNLTTRWLHEGTERGGSFGQGVHSISVADVDADGFDEIVMGSATIDHDGKLLCTTGFGHGDAIHLSDFDPTRPGLEIFMPHEESGCGYGDDMHDPATGEIIYRGYSDFDNGRGMAADFFFQIDPVTGIDRYYGGEFWSIGSKGVINAVTKEVISEEKPSINFRIYWDGDLYDDLFDGRHRHQNGFGRFASCDPVISSWDGEKCVNIHLNEIIPGNWNSSNGSKSNPCLSADIWGDWREEIILWSNDDPSVIGIFTTPIPTEYPVSCLMQDHVYRMGVVWQNSSYNQPPHLGYYLPDRYKNKK